MDTGRLCRFEFLTTSLHPVVIFRRWKLQNYRLESLLVTERLLDKLLDDTYIYLYVYLSVENIRRYNSCSMLESNDFNCKIID